MKEFEDTPELVKSITGNIRDLSDEEAVELKLAQLELLVNPSLDREITWIENAAVKTPFYDGYTYKTTTFKYFAGPKLIAKIRGHAIVALVNDLSRLECIGRAREIIYASSIPHNLRKLQDKNTTSRFLFGFS